MQFLFGNGTQGSYGQGVGSKYPLGKRAYFLPLYRINTGYDLLRRYLAPKINLVSCQPCHTVIGALHSQKIVPLQELFCRLQFLLAYQLRGATRQLLFDNPQGLLESLSFGRDIDAKDPGVAIGGQIGTNLVGKSPFLPNFLKQPGTHAPSQNGVQ